MPKQFDDDRWFLEEHVGELTDAEWDAIRNFTRVWADIHGQPYKESLLSMHMATDWLLHKWNRRWKHLQGSEGRHQVIVPEDVVSALEAENERLRRALSEAEGRRGSND